MYRQQDSMYTGNYKERKKWTIQETKTKGNPFGLNTYNTKTGKLLKWGRWWRTNERLSWQGSAETITMTNHKLFIYRAYSKTWYYTWF